MANNETLLTSLNFMNDAAHLLAYAAPETSAYIMSQRSSLMFHSNLEQSDSQRQHVCSSCGRIMIPGQGSIIRLDGERATRKTRTQRRATKEQPKPPETKISKTMTCGNCGRYTKISVPPPPDISRARIKLKQKAQRLENRGQAAHHVVQPPQLVSEPEPAKASVNANSKKRAKNRKQGLQALLQQSQASSAKSGLGLSLTDFMKK